MKQQQKKPRQPTALSKPPRSLPPLEKEDTQLQEAANAKLAYCYVWVWHETPPNDED